jgi:Mrp family chromosome partitioning ATPase
MHAPQELEVIGAQALQHNWDAPAFEAKTHNEQVALGLLRLLFRNWAWIGLGVLLALVLATALLRFGPRSYVAESVIRLNFASSSAASASSAPRVALDASAVVESEARMVRSRNVAEKVVSRLHLADDQDFGGPPGLIARTINAIMQRPATIEDESSPRNVTDASTRFDRAVAKVMRSTTVENDNKSYLIGIKFRWSTPKTAATLAAAIAEEYLRERQVQTLLASKSSLESELAQLALRLGRRHPTYIATKAKLAEVDRRIAERNTASDPVDSAAVGDFSADIAMPAQAPPFPASPNPKVVYGLALLAGFLISVLLVVLRQRYGTRLDNEWTLSNRLGVRCFGAMPAPRSIGLRRLRAAIFEAVRSIAIAAGFDVKTAGCRVVVVASSLPDEGKTLFASTLAGVMAESGQRVLLLDAVPDVKGKKSSPPRGAGPGANATSPIVDEAATALYRTAFVRDRTAIVTGESFDRYLADVRDTYDLIIVKAPPVLMLSDAAHYSRRADAIILLVRWHRTPAPAAAEAIRRLDAAGVSISGAVLSNVRLKHGGSGDLRDQSHYLAKYKKFYTAILS